MGAVFFPSFFSIASKNGYRYYTDKELERLQQIMFYRELDFSLGQIKIALENEPNRLICLEQQRTLLIERKERLTKILDTLDETISHAQKGAAIREHIVFLQRDTEIDAASFAAQSHFFLSDDFHRSMMESQQVGLSYYVCIAAGHFTTTEK